MEPVSYDQERLKLFEGALQALLSVSSKLLKAAQKAQHLTTAVLAYRPLACCQMNNQRHLLSYWLSLHQRMCAACDGSAKS
jgi:hypothetical protein